MTRQHELFSHDGVPGAAGTIAHTVVARILVEAHEMPPVDVVQIQGMVQALCQGLGGNKNARRIYCAAMAGASKYLNLLMPRDCSFQAAEICLEHSKPDLVWGLADGGVFFDELKTGRYVRDQHIQQCMRQRDDGISRYGAAFIGVRLVGTTQQGSSLFIPARGDAVALSDTALSFPALRSSASDRRAA